MAGAYRLLSGGDIDARLRQRHGKNEDEGYNVLATLLPLSIFREFFTFFFSRRRRLSVVANFFLLNEVEKNKPGLSKLRPGGLLWPVKLFNHVL